MPDRSTRLSERLKLDIPLRVRHRVNSEQEWIEETRLDEATQMGAGFTLTRPVEPGRLVHLSMPLPGKLRLFDFVEINYQLWAVVRYIRMISTDENCIAPFSIGAAFIGKEPPTSYRLDPTIRYDLKPVIKKEGLWAARERPRQCGRYALATDDRIPMVTKVIIESFNELGKITNREETETVNISTGGAAVWSNINPDYENFIRVISPEFNLSILAVIRGQHIDPERGRCLHLEFISCKLPVEQLTYNQRS
jgi:hypothetical protein